MNLIELNQALRQLRLGGMAARPGDAFTSSPGGGHGLPSISFPVWSLMNLPDAATACWNGVISKPAFATH